MESDWKIESIVDAGYERIYTNLDRLISAENYTDKEVLAYLRYWYGQDIEIGYDNWIKEGA